jgi:hypothetical protein
MYKTMKLINEEGGRLQLKLLLSALMPNALDPRSKLGDCDVSNMTNFVANGTSGMFYVSLFSNITSEPWNVKLEMSNKSINKRINKQIKRD